MRLTFVAFAALLSFCGVASAQTEPVAPPEAAEPAAPAPAAEPAPPAAPGEGINIELNKLEVAANACLGYFIVENGLPEPLQELQIDVFFFDRQEVILRRVALTFLDVRPGRAKVVLFELDIPCADISRLLLNEVIACTQEGGSPIAGCADRLTVSTRAEAEFAY